MSQKHVKKLLLTAGVIMALVFTSASACEANVDEAMRNLGLMPGTFINYGQDGQVVFQADCASLAFTRDTEYDRKDESGKVISESAVVKVTCGDSIFSTVGYTSVYMTNGAKDNLMADSQQFANIRVQNNNRSIPLVNFVWRDVKDKFVGTAQIAQVSDQWNNPILAFASKHVVGMATDVDKSTMFKLDDDNNDGYIWVGRGAYMKADRKLLESATPLR